jgi:hypothetical protein
MEGSREKGLDYILLVGEGFNVSKALGRSECVWRKVLRHLYLFPSTGIKQQRHQIL